MAARKRSREFFEDDEVEIDSASSSLQASTSKRPRTVLAAENGGSVVSDEDDDDNQSTTVGGHSRYTSVAPSEMQDDGGIDELLGTQIIQKQFRQFKENKAEESGIIEEVFCRNFMCHSKLRIRLGPLINFIIGHNGSGKSAVLTALTMCLGGKAATTNRGSSLKSMIKEGEETATLAVKIKNQGDGAYRPDVYGQSITVERHFSKAGSSGFKLKNADDKLVSTKKKDLDELIDYFALQLDNPINVLNQDMARQFLSNSSAQEKYKFFLRGTQLEMLDKDYKLLEERLDGIEAKLQSREDDIVTLKRQADEAEKKKKRLDATDTIHLEVNRTRRQFAWAQVAEQEEYLEKCQDEVTRAEAAIGTAERAAEQKSAEFDEEKNVFDAAKEEVRKLQEEQLAREQSAFDTLKESFDDGTSKLRDIMSDLRQGKDEYKAVQARRKNLDEQIRLEQDRLDAAADDGRGERMDRLNELEQLLNQAKIDLATHEQGLATLMRDKDNASQALDSAKAPLQDKQRALEQAKDRLERLQAQQRGRYGAYKRNTEQLVNAVGHESRWRGQKPVGPMGQFIRVRKPEWTGIIEKMFGQNLEAWIVTCQEDRIRLADIMRRNQCVTPIVIGNPEPLNVSNGEPDGDVDTILRILDFQSDIVRNQAIINQSVEQIVLIPDRKRGNDYMYSNPRPRNVRAVLTFNNTRNGGGFRLDCMRSGAARLSPIQAWRGASRLQVDQREQIRTHQEDVDRSKLELNRLEGQKGECQRQLMAANQALERHKRRRRDLVHGEQSASDDLEALREELERNKPQDGRLQELQRQLNDAREEEDGHRRIVEDLVRARTTQDEEQKGAKEQVDDAFNKLEKVKHKLLRHIDQSRRAERAYHAALRAKNEAFAIIADEKQRLVDVTEARDTQDRVVREEFVAAAEQMCPRVPLDPGVTPQMLDDRLARFQKDLERFEEEAGGTREEITEAWKNACVTYNNARKEYQNIKSMSDTMKKSLAHRTYRWDKFRSHISYRAQVLFSLLLSERGFRGRIDMSHDNKTLDLKVEPDLTRVSDKGREANTLSGGEKSFSTICLLLSIWEAMGSPIRCLDEFDVFMDSVNRATSMTMMIQGARRSVGRQFILITPQSMQNVQLGDDVKIHRMSDPERGQQTLPFTQA